VTVTGRPARDVFPLLATYLFTCTCFAFCLLIQLARSEWALVVNQPEALARRLLADLPSLITPLDATCSR
jgi:hypothetical protein